MARHNETGKTGEQLATKWLIDKGYTIIENNWRCGKLEIDIIAYKEGILHFIEVKTRSSSNFGYPEILVTQQKMIHFVNAGSAYIRLRRQFKKIRFDILSVNLYPERDPDFFLIEDVYL